MLVLALDTTTKGGSCAVARDGVVVREQRGDPDRAHDRRLPGDLLALLDDVQLALADFDIYAVATGPGSFTGLRIGIATMQGLAFAEGKPLIGIPAFDALARIGSRQGSDRVATWIDAWRGEVYAALYESGHEVRPPSVQQPSVLLPSLEGRRTLFIGDAVDGHRQAIRDALRGDAWIAEPSAPLLAGALALMATERARSGHHPAPHAIRPLYVRRPDAELARDPRPVG